MLEIICLEKKEFPLIPATHVKYEILRDDDPMDLFNFEDKEAMFYLYTKMMNTTFIKVGSYKRTKDDKLTSIMIICHLN